MNKKIFFYTLFLIIGIFFIKSSVYAETNVVNPITDDTLWKLEGSPYIVNPLERDLYVEADATLTIEPGVIIKFANRRALDVRGILKAVGTPTEHIIFTSLYDLSNNPLDQPHKGDWYGIKINGNNSHLTYTEIKYSGKDGYKDYSDAALVLVGENHILHHNFITGSDSDCLYMYFAFASVKNNIFQKCEGNGISTNEGKADISHNIIQHNEKNGIILKSYANLRANIIQKNKLNGIIVISGNPEIRNNHIDSNGLAGIDLTVSFIESIKGNAITANYRGIILRTSDKIEIKNNDFFRNEVGIDLQDVKANNALYSLIDARDNYWGDKNGPFDPSDDFHDKPRNAEGLFNPETEGDPVADYINYYPWAETPNTRLLVSQNINTAEPEKPKLAGAYFVDNHIIVSWLEHEETDIIGYHVFKSKEQIEGYEKIGTVNVNFFKDYEFERGEKYYYKITAVDFSGNESVLSYPVTVQIGEFTRSLFKDIRPIDWHFFYINYLSEKGVIKGYEDNTFHPDQTVTRAELTKMVLATRRINVDRSLGTRFQDTDIVAWYTPYISKAFDLNIISGYPGNKFLPDNPVSRSEALKIILSAFNKSVDRYTTQNFQDVSKRHWAHSYVEYAVSRGIIKQKSHFYPNDPITRAEAAKIITQVDRLEF